MNNHDSKALWRQERAQINRELAALVRKINVAARRLDMQEHEPLDRLWADPEGGELLRSREMLRDYRVFMNQKVRDGRVVVMSVTEGEDTLWLDFDKLTEPLQ
jgi:hypothetical protein